MAKLWDRQTDRCLFSFYYIVDMCDYVYIIMYVYIYVIRSYVCSFSIELQASLEDANSHMQQAITVNETRDSTSGMDMNRTCMT